MVKLIEFNEEFKKKDPDLKQMWGVLSGLIHWMLNDQQMFIRETQFPYLLRLHSCIGG